MTLSFGVQFFFPNSYLDDFLKWKLQKSHPGYKMVLGHATWPHFSSQVVQEQITHQGECKLSLSFSKRTWLYFVEESSQGKALIIVQFGSLCRPSCLNKENRFEASCQGRRSIGAQCLPWGTCKWAQEFFKEPWFAPSNKEHGETTFFHENLGPLALSSHVSPQEQVRGGNCLKLYFYVF